MNNNTIIFMDYETTGKDKNNTQPTQLAAVAIDPKKLEIIETGIFNSDIRPIFDKDKQLKNGLGEIEDKALEITGMSIERLEKAPDLKVVWAQFCTFVNQFNKTGRLWDAPICAGFNNNRFDDIITDRIIGGNCRLNPTYSIEEKNELGKMVTNTYPTKEPYKLGPWDDKKGQSKLFHPRDNFDLLRMLFHWFESDYTVKSYSMDNMREKFGINKEGAHSGIVDVLQGAMLLIKFMKLTRHVHKQMRSKFNNTCFEEENKTIARIMSKYENKNQ